MGSMDSGTLIEQQVPPANLTHLKFSVLNESDTEKLSVLSINVVTDVTNAKLGLPNEASECATCGATDIGKCDGHFGFIKLPMDLCHPFYVSELVKILNNICPACKCNKSEFRTKVKAKTRKTPKPPNDQRRSCNYCGGSSENWLPKAKFKASTRTLFGKMASAVLVEVNEKLPKKYQNKKLSDVLPDDYWSFIKEDPSQEEMCMKSNMRFLSSSQVYYLLKDIDPNSIEKLVLRRESLFLTCLPVPSNGNRVTETANRLFFDERTKAYKRLVDFKGQANELGLRVRDCLSVSKLHSENSSNIDIKSGLKWLKDVVLAKRTDHSFRLVVVGDPNIKFGEIGIPQDICQELTISENLNKINWEKLRDICKWSLLLKGKFQVRRKGELLVLKNVDALEIGDTVHRHLNEGDLLLVNRPPSIHQHSLLALSVRVLPMASVVSLNPVCCSPLRGDFDGDCLHGYIPQSINSTTELRELVAMNRQLINGQNGRNLLSFCHDSLTAAYLLREKGVFLNKYQMQQLGMAGQRKLLDPAILKASPHQNSLWTGNQLLSMLFPCCFNYVSPSNGIHINKGEIMDSSLESSWLHDTDDNIFCSLVKCYGSKSLDILYSAQEVLLEWISMRGLSVSLSDLYLCSDSYSRNKMLEEVCCGLHEAEQSFHTKQLRVDPAPKSIFRHKDNQNFAVPEVGPSCHLDKMAVLNRLSVGAFKQVFGDLQSLVLHYLSNDNSLLAMVKAGSKGSLRKLIQQGVTLGLQHSSVSLSFGIPCKMSLRSGSEANTVPYAVVGSSFLKGLDPLECFMHSVSSRSVSFADNADVPGTIFKKLMFYMRDLYLAYDGTVRSSNGNQLVQFSYGFSEDSCFQNNGFFVENTYDFLDMGGPVGSLAACSISEAAYSALDQPISTLESSPLLNLKKLLESSQKRTAVNQTVSLFLSNKLARWLYGFEYGALKVKSHLERVLFSDVVSTVMIIDVSFSKEITSRICPWICHFHVCKEAMKKRGLNVESIIDVLERESNATGEKLTVNLPKSCSIDDAEEENNDVLCITLTAEVSTSPPMLLDTLRDSVIPFLLGTVIKGFLEFKKVDILWSDTSRSEKVSTGELYLKVHLSETCKSGKCWSLLVNKSLQIMDLIDWGRSHPDNIPDIYCAYGIDCAREYFLKNLKVVVSDIGKSILQKHLLLVADCLSLTGEFIGLNAKGIAKHRDLASVSSPFTQACFASPESCFIKAAKEGAKDCLLGALDAAAWGKKVPLGTGGQFDILYSGKGHEFAQPVDVYSTLSGHINTKRKDVKIRIPTAHTDLSEKWEGKTNNPSIPKEEKSSVYLPRSYVRGSVNMIAIQDKMQLILHNKYSINEYLSEIDRNRLMTALCFHPRSHEKIGAGIQDIKVGTHPIHNSRCFFLIRKDGTVEDFSYRKCLIGAAKQLYGLKI